MFYINQTFKDIYPPEAAVWCNENNAYIDELAPGVFQIKEVLPLTEEEKLIQEYYDAKANLDRTDYAPIKIFEGVATREEYKDVLALREQWRATVRRAEPYLTKVQDG